MTGADVGSAIDRLEAKTRREAMDIRLRASAEAEAASAAELAEANGALDRRIRRLRALRTELADASDRIERDLVRVATEIRRRGESAYPAGP